MFKKTFFHAAVISALTIVCGGASAGTLIGDPQMALAKIQKQDPYFVKKIHKVADNVYTAVGFHGATTSMIVGDDGIILIDSLFGPKSAGDAFAEFRKITDLPVKAIIYTHGHQDHVGGASAYLKGAKGDVKIIAAQNLSNNTGADAVVNPLLIERGIMQFGRTLPKEQLTNRGLAPSGTYDKDMMKGFVEPNLRVNGSLNITIAGIDLVLKQVSGETNDHLYVWMPKQRVLFCGDNFYKAFPNLYAIRGTPYRDVRAWAKTTAELAALKPEVLVPGHTTPIIGQDQAVGALTDYSKAIQFVFDETVKGMNRFEDPETIAQSIRLPDELANKPWLSEVYGNIENASRAVFSGLVGWFDGRPVNLHPLSKAKRADRYAQLLGTPQQAIERLLQAEKGESVDDYQWGLELVEVILPRTDLSEAQRTQVIQSQIRLLRSIAKHESNPVNRNFYLTFAQRLEKRMQ